MGTQGEQNRWRYIILALGVVIVVIGGIIIKLHQSGSPQSPEKRPGRQLWAIFLERDYDDSGTIPRVSISNEPLNPRSQEACGRTKFASIWGKVSDVLDHAKNMASKMPLRIELYALGSENPFHVADFGSMLEKADEAQWPVDRERIVEEEIPQLAAGTLEKGRSEYAELIDRGGNNTQDIVQSVKTIMGKQNSWFEKKENYALVRVIYISDMVQYNVKKGQSDIASGLFNMALPDDLVTFRDSYVNDGKLTKEDVLRGLPRGDQRFEVWNIDVAPCDSEDFGLGTDPNWAMLRSEVASIWQNVFKALGAKTYWNMSDLKALEE